jgi:poly(beta-D-mannuronate) lyase
VTNTQAISYSKAASFAARLRSNIVIGLMLLLTTAAVMVFITETAGAKEYLAADPAELRVALAAARPGDTVIMKNGVWPNVSIVINGRDGTAEHPIILRAETLGQVFLTGTSTLRIGRDYWVVDGLVFRDGGFLHNGPNAIIEFRENPGQHAHHSRLTNTAIISYNATEGVSKDYKWISLYGAYNRVDHNYLYGKNHQGSTVVVWRGDDSPNYHLIDHNYFSNFAELPKNGGEAIRIGTSEFSLSASHTIVEYNLFIDCHGDIELISSKSGHNIIRYNTVVSSKGGITLRHGNNSQVYGNFVFGNGVANTVGIRIVGENHRIYNNYITGVMGSTSSTGVRAAVVFMEGIPDSPLNGHHQVCNVIFAHNTLVDNRKNVHFGAGRDHTHSLPPIGITFANNIIKSHHGPLIDYFDTPDVQYEGNILYGAFVGIPLRALPDGGITITNPQLTLAADGLYRPAPGSPAIDGAVGDEDKYGYIIDDMDGQLRSGLKRDIGADEIVEGEMSEADTASEKAGACAAFAPAASACDLMPELPVHPLKRPLTARDVGPVWMIDEDL